LQKKLENHLRNKNYEVCTAVAHCFPSILDVMILENINLCSDEMGRPPLQSNEKKTWISVIRRLYMLSAVYIFQPHVNFICALDIAVFNFSEKMT
jgi:hypothetical protein